jgi:DNA-binding transcriptional LysR family regulator
VDLCRQVGSGALDAAIVVEPQFAVAKTCEWRSLVEEPLIVVAPAALAGRQAHELLRSEPFIRYDRSVLGGKMADRYLRDQGIRPRQRLEIDGLMAIAWSKAWAWRAAGLRPVAIRHIARIPLPERSPSAVA